jgi:hypothetical protein
MPKRSPEDIIRIHKKMINKTLDEIDERPKAIASTSYESMGSSATRIALKYLVLNNRDEAISWFNKSAEYYKSSKKIKDNFSKDFAGKFEYRKYFTETMALHMIISAVLSENMVQVREISKDILEIPPHKTSNNHLTFDYVNSLATLILDSSEFYPTQINKFKELEDKYAKTMSGAYNGMAKSLLAICNKDENSIMEGINQILDQFHMRIKRSKEIPICLDALMLLKLGEIKGLQMNLDKIEEKYHKYVTKCMF